MESYSSKEAFNASMMVHFRKKIGMELINKINKETGQWEVLEACKWRKENRTSDTKECRYVRNWLI
jgi:hypothetical protein